MSRKEIVRFLVRRDGNRCFICKRPFTHKHPPTIDHWIPKSRGGTWHITNLRLAHKRCNNVKGDIMPISDTKVVLPKKNRRNRKKVKPAICGVCQEGRLLKEGQFCEVCNQVPQPIQFPAWAKKSVQECDHNIYHCFSCVVGSHFRRRNYAGDIA